MVADATQGSAKQGSHDEGRLARGPESDQHYDNKELDEARHQIDTVVHVVKVVGRV
jgi:hypothetical protein